MEDRQLDADVVGNIQAASLMVSTDVGGITGLGLIFDSIADARQVLQQLQAVYDVPRTLGERLTISFEEVVDACKLTVIIVTNSKRVRLDINYVSRTILEDLQKALRKQKYYFVIFCTKGADGEVIPYEAANNHIVKSDMLINGKKKSCASNGLWPMSSNLFGFL